MAQLLHFSDFQAARKGKPFYFGRQDLLRMLSLYASQVARGVWRDYSLDHMPDRAIFSIYKRTQEAPTFQLIKYKTKMGARYGLVTRHKQIKSSKNLEGILSALRDYLE